VLDAQRQYHQARLVYVKAGAQRYQDTTQLIEVTGGGWKRRGNADVEAQRVP
jgi:outer membrane protein TolC